MIKKIFVITSLFAMVCVNVMNGQNSRSLHLLELNSDSRTAGMGDASMGGTTGMYLYTNPTALFQNEKKSYASYSFGLYPKIEDSRQTYHAISTGYKLFDKHALLVGFRYLGGLEVTTISGEGDQEGKPIRPMDWSIDLAYAFQLNQNLSLYAGGNIIQSYIGLTAYTGSFNAGFYYRNNLSLATTEGSYSLGLSLNNLGGKIKYGKEGSENNLPTSMALGGSLTLAVNDNHKLTGAATTRYFLLPSEAKAFVGGAGAEYEIFNLAALRAGYHWGDNNNYFTMGLGCKVKFVNIDAAYLFADNKDYNLLRLSVGVQF